MLNIIILMGRLTADPELKTTSSGAPVTSFALAVERNYSKEDKVTDFINIVAWNKTAEFVSRYFSKGQLVAVQGSLQTRKYTDKEGNNRTAYEVVAAQVYFAEPKRGNNDGRVVYGAPFEAPRQQTGKPSGDFDVDYISISADDDLLF